MIRMNENNTIEVDKVAFWYLQLAYKGKRTLDFIKKYCNNCDYKDCKKYINKLVLC